MAETPAPEAAAELSVHELFSIAGSFSSTLDLDSLLLKIGQAAERLINSEASSIMLLDDSKKFLFFKTATGTKAGAVKRITVEIGKGIAGWVAANKQPLIVNDTKTDPRFTGMVDKASGFQTRSLMCVPMFYRGDLVGVAEVLNKRAGTYTDTDLGLLNSLANLASVAITNAKLVQDQKNFFSHILEILSASIEASKPRYEGHTTRSAQLACVLARFMEVSKEDYQAIYYAGLLHDLGYVGLKNKRILDEMGIMDPSEEIHAAVSVKMLEGIHMLQAALPLIRYHHERFDGTGPNKIKADEIPLGARILALVEAVEDLRMIGLQGAEFKDKAIQEAQNGAGNRFDPVVVQVFVDYVQSREEYEL